MKLEHGTELLKLLAEPSRLRLLMLLKDQELTVAELAHITDLKQPRVSTHLSKLKEAALVIDRRAGVQAFYRLSDAQSGAGDAAKSLLNQWFAQSPDQLLKQDQARVAAVLSSRAGLSWADQVAGDMERHYSPGRTWDTLARTLMPLLTLGQVLDVASGDGALAELLAPRAAALLCVDQSAAVIQAARIRLEKYANVEVQRADMHDLQLQERRFDLALLMQALPYSDRPEILFQEVFRVLKPGGQVLGSALQSHAFEAEVAPYGHKNLGYTLKQLLELMRGAGFTQVHAQRASRERKAPHFEILIFSAHRP